MTFWTRPYILPRAKTEQFGSRVQNFTWLQRATTQEYPPGTNKRDLSSSESCWDSTFRENTMYTRCVVILPCRALKTSFPENPREVKIQCSLRSSTGRAYSLIPTTARVQNTQRLAGCAVRHSHHSRHHLPSWIQHNVLPRAKLCAQLKPR